MTDVIYTQAELDEQCALEYERGKLHGANDLGLSQRHCQALQYELDEAKRERSEAKLEAYKLRRKLNQAGLPTAYWNGDLE